MNQKDIFLSHRSVNKAFVNTLASDIEKIEYNSRYLTTWLDEAEIRPGDSIPGLIEKGLQTSRFFGIVMTPDYFNNESGWTDAEWHAALFNDPDNRKGKIVPILAEDCPYIPYLLAHLNAIDLRSKNYKKNFGKLIAVLRDQPIPRPITYRGQLITSSGHIDRKTLISERGVLDADPDTVTEKLFCNMLEIESLPKYVYFAKISPKYKTKKLIGEEYPTKTELREHILKNQEKNNFEKTFSPIFRMYRGTIITFHDLSSPDNPFGDVFDERSVGFLPINKYIQDEEQRKIIVSMLNMSIDRHMTKRGLVLDNKNDGRYYFPPKDGNENLVIWKPNKITATRTVAKPHYWNGTIQFWHHLGAYIRVVFIGNKFYLKIIPTWVITTNGVDLMQGSKVSSIANRWTGKERNIHLLYHIRFWTYILQGGRRSPTIWVRTGDQRIEISSIPSYVQLAYGIENDHINLMEELDKQADTLNEIEKDLGDSTIIYEGIQESENSTELEEEI